MVNFGGVTWNVISRVDTSKMDGPRVLSQVKLNGVDFTDMLRPSVINYIWQQTKLELRR